MARRRVIAASFLAVILICLQVGPARPAILEKANQLVNLVKATANPITLSDFQRRLPNGEIVDYSLPAGQVFILTKMSWNFTATATALNGDVLLTVGNYYRAKVTLVDGYGALVDGISPGVPITNMSQAVRVSMFGDPAETPVPGTLSIRLVGYTAPNN